MTQQKLFDCSQVVLGPVGEVYSDGIVLDDSNSQVCTKCRNRLHVSYFNRNVNTKSGLSSRCRQCRRDYENSLDYRAREIVRGHPIHRNSDRSKLRIEWAKKLLVLPCPVCGVTYSLRGSGHGDTCASIDRRNPSIGYIENNCTIMCYKCNRRKTDFATAQEIRDFADALERAGAI